MCAEVLVLFAGRRGFVGDVVVGASADKCYIAGAQFDRRGRISQPQPSAALDDSVDCQLDGAREPQPPGRTGYRPGEDSPGGACSDQMILENIHN
jgi:hypothetical protein